MPLLDNRASARVLVIRPDRIGDVVLSTPVFSSIRKGRPGWKISVLVRPLLTELLENHPGIDEIIPLTTDDKPGFSNTASLAGILAQKKFDAAIHLYSDFWISLAVWRASVPLRIGPASKLAKVFYNHPVVQHRSKGDRHETDYNLELLEPFGISPVREPSLAVREQLDDETASLLDSEKKNVGIFPGSGGSARNWKPEKYAELIDTVRQNDVNLILMGGPNESELLANVESITRQKPLRYKGKTLMELASFIKRLDCFVAPSTGPLHIASAVGTPAIGIYCPIRVCLPSRWGPIGSNDTSFVPDVPVCEECTIERCGYYDCMDKLEVKTVANAVKERL